MPESGDIHATDYRHEDPAPAREAREPQSERETMTTSYASERAGSMTDTRETHREETVVAPVPAETVREQRSAPAYQPPEPERSPEPDKATTENVGQKSEEPTRKGWWQKRFGSA